MDTEAPWPLSEARGTPEYLRPWRGAALEAPRLESAAALIDAAMREPAVSPEHRKRLVELLLWDLTEADGKYRTRYRSEGTRTLPPSSRWKPLLRHEHVIERGSLRDAILTIPHPDRHRLRELLSTSLACVVTVEEDARLRQVRQSHLHGWDRYRAAKITVWDLSTTPPHRLALS